MHIVPLNASNYIITQLEKMHRMKKEKHFMLLILSSPVCMICPCPWQSWRKQCKGIKTGTRLLWIKTYWKTKFVKFNIKHANFPIQPVIILHIPVYEVCGYLNLFLMLIDIFMFVWSFWYFSHYLIVQWKIWVLNQLHYTLNCSWDQWSTSSAILFF